MNSDDTISLVKRALDGNPTAQNELVALLTPVIQARVARTLARRSLLAGGRSVREEVKDLTQDVLLKLFARDGRVLRSWQPERGLSLANFVGLVAEREALSFLRRKEEPSLTVGEIDVVAPDPSPVKAAASRQQLALLLERLREELSPQGWQLFDLLFLQDLSQAEVRAASGLSAVAVYAWHSRLRRLARRLRDELSGP